MHWLIVSCVVPNVMPHAQAIPCLKTWKAWVRMRLPSLEGKEAKSKQSHCSENTNLCFVILLRESHEINFDASCVKLYYRYLKLVVVTQNHLWL